ncbi:MAG TPA: DDE-type integrase/transposase/recombinase [Methylorubrum populi]|jgi:putative transposase|uniref:DDE-type integrase/transposase/recombinase n=1 Tax=Methylorubrum populi TaxID=223967 RepID=A0A921E0S4_9HYPH|nr:DDE-type integrase/transposase/recombinase [Methylorubrum populi]
MGPFKLTNRDIVVIDDLRWLPTTALEDGIALRPIDGGPAKAHSWHELVMLWVDRRMRIEPEPCKGLPATLIEDMRRDISGFTEQQQSEAIRRAKYIRLLEFAIELRDGRRVTSNRPDRKRKNRHIVLKAKELDWWCKRWARQIEPGGVSQAPCGGSLIQWYRRYKLSGGLRSALVPQSHRQGNRVPRLSPIAVKVMNEFARNQYLQREQPKASKIFPHVRDEIRVVARKAGVPEDDIAGIIPNIQSFYKIIRSMGSLETEIYRGDAKKSKHRHRIKALGPRYEWIGQAVQIDSTELPMVVRDPATGLTFKQVTLTVVIDLATRAIVGWYVGLEKGFATIQEALRMTMMPKTWMSKLDGITNEYLATVKPSVVFTDQGSDYRSNDLVVTCGQLNIRLKHTPAGAPDLKGIVERQFLTSKQGMFAGMPGSLFKNGDRFSDYRAGDHVEMTMEQVNWIVCKFVADVWMQEWASGIEDSPAGAWRRLSNIRHPEMAPSIDHLVPLVSKVQEKVTIQHTGVEWMNLFYGFGSEALQELLNREGPGKRQYRMRIDALDVGRAYLLVDGEWIVLAASDPAARGRPVHDHLVIRAEARSRKKRHERVHQPDMDAAKRRLYAPAEARNNKRAAQRISSRKARLLVEEVDNLAEMKATYIEAIDPETTHIAFDDIEYRDDDESDLAHESPIRARPRRPEKVVDHSAQRPPRRPIASAAPLRKPAEIRIVEDAENPPAVVGAVREFPVSPVNIKPEMPSAASANAVDVPTRRRRNFRIASFS